MEKIYQLKIELRDSNPQVWRCIQVDPEISFSDLHDIIQLSMGWEKDHMYHFNVGKLKIYDFEERIDDYSDLAERDSMDTFLDELIKRAKSKVFYTYDFGDSWEHVIQLEKKIPVEEHKSYPICIDGGGACPPEDCGGIWGYQNMLKILTDQTHPEYEEMIEWIGEGWDADYFDMDHVNSVLQDYQTQVEEIYEPSFTIERDEDDGYKIIKKFKSPADIFSDEYEATVIQEWLEQALRSATSVELKTYERLLNLGFDQVKAKKDILEALSIEWFYDLKYGTDHLTDRYDYNLDQLPEAPQEIPRLSDAFMVINQCLKGIPYLAIDYLKNETSVEVTSIILKELKNHSDHQYCWNNCENTPLWYAFAAEGHLCEELIDVVIDLYEDNDNPSEWLDEQGQYLIGKLAQKYPELTTQKVLEAIEKDIDLRSKPSIYYLFDTFYFCEKEVYKARLLQILEHDDILWYSVLATHVAQLQIEEALPILKRKLLSAKSKPDQDMWVNHLIIELEEAVRILEHKLILEEALNRPFSIERESDWKEFIIEDEWLFYEEDGEINDFGYSDPFVGDPNEPFLLPNTTNLDPFIKEKTPGRNDPCPCGSGKKYKKCCIDK
jgi:hypothetical protein